MYDHWNTAYTSTATDAAAVTPVETLRATLSETRALISKSTMLAPKKVRTGKSAR
jgi:predicted ATP-dependent serine protease